MDAEGSHILGDVTQDGILGVWMSKTARSYRENHINNRSSCIPCGQCNQSLPPPELC